MDEAEKREFWLVRYHECEHIREYVISFWPPAKRSRYQHWLSLRAGHARDWVVPSDMRALIRRVNFNENNRHRTWGDPSSCVRFLIQMDEAHPLHPEPVFLFRIGEICFFLIPEHRHSPLHRYHYEVEEHRRHPSYTGYGVLYGSEDGVTSPPPRPDRSLWVFHDHPSPLYWQQMEIFRPPLEAPTAYLDGSSPRPIKALPLEFGFFLGTLWGRKNKPEYEAARRDKYDRDWMHNFEPTPLVVLLHPIDKSYWVLFNYLPGKKRSGPWTKNLSDTHHNTHSDNCDLCEMCCERCYEPTDLWTHETWRGYRYEEQVRELWRVEPIERLEDSDFWERAGITPFSVLRIPPLGDDDDSSEDDSCPKWIFDEELVETEPEKEEEQSSRDHGPFIEVVQSNCEEATAYKMFSEATNVRPNPFKAKHAEWKEYWDKYVSVPAPGASPSSAANQEGQDQGPGPSEQPVVEEWRCASCPKCRLRNQPTGNEEDNEDEETERWPEPEREMMHMPRVRLNPGKRRRRPRVKPGRGGTSAKVEVEAEPEPASASSPEPQRPSSTGGSGQQEGT